MNQQRRIVLGLFFLATIGVLGSYTMFLSDATLFGLFGKVPTRRATFPEARGLREGDPILVAGVRAGRVRKLSVDWNADPDARIRATLIFEEEIVLREGSSIAIADATLLGGRHVLIDPGPPGEPVLPPDMVLEGYIQPNPIEAASALIEDMRVGRGTFGRLISDDALADEVADSLASAARTLQNLERATHLLVTGEGTIGALLSEREVYDELLAITENLRQIAADAAEVTAAMKSGDGLVARVIHDEDMAEDVAGTIADLRQIVGDIRAGRGTLGALFADDDLANNANAILAGLVRGDGTLGALLQDRELYDNVAQSIDDLALVSSVIRNGEGSLGRFLMDDEIYLDARRALGLLSASLEEVREAAPVTTFTSVLFGAF
jgi:phospholipid/cholesterol/gamma-HCH transport system substrate-binding protein